mmetsp:Transcript_11042/g.24623  ORF Transcript_11042/g.24623 Transcript_11042/m.24623 type:complete len:1461 (+) Transcript_11042:338-4720(+)|eukprot:CAMPEP_0168816992 /NCGR_PEP_ID=MMETSP0726-20121227/7004_1 /TAXON_ID=265536 /ORGANISM="Amphiprora sp., Strain CCMP467" /LENGTH=1460 /DNA_ID=CAMNT_0008869259 /DNA_START=321 /DNA_END=4703 /DNA_ORIENTATION=-
MGRRKRSSSGGSYKEQQQHQSDNEDGTASTLKKVAVTQQKQRQQRVQEWMITILESRQRMGKSTVLHEPHNLALLSAYVVRAQQLDDAATAAATATINHRLQEQVFLQADVESHYTALHWALFRGDLATILFLLRHAASCQDHNKGSSNTSELEQPRLKQKPMALLEFAPTSNNSQNQQQQQQQYNLWQKLVCARDAEGATPAQLLAYEQRSELRACRQGLPRPQITATTTTISRRPRQASFELPSSSLEQPENQDQEVAMEFSSLMMMNGLRRQEGGGDDDGSSQSSSASHPIHHHHHRQGGNNNNNNSVQYGCEVLTFGRAHHCALGVGTDGNSSTTTTTTPAATITHPGDTATTTTTTTFRPQRVQEFAQSRVGRSHSAVAVAAAAHHTLVLNRAGQLFSFGLGKGGRLGTGTERHSPQPTLLTSLYKNNRRIVAIAAAENHSLAVTSNGQVYAWGSNRFGQLGMDTTTNNSSSSQHHNGNKKQPAAAAASSSSCVLVPRRIDDLREINIQTVAAGEKHSVAVSSQGKLYVWGDNSSGQLGLAPRSSSKNSGSREKVQQCTTAGLGSKTVIAVAASEYATLSLTLPARDRRTVLPINSIYMMGHGNHVPYKVHLGPSRQRGNSMTEDSAGSSNHRHQHAQSHSPVAIASAKFHNVAITKSGLVYTWGLHAETLGTASPRHSTGPKKKSSGAMMVSSTAQLVERMLPENGGGLAVSVSASENHTAVLTDTGALFTWGSTFGPNIMGHMGVRFQPDPRKVPGLYRGVAVAAAKEHFVVLSGTSFPPTPKTPLPASAKMPSLENFAALRVMEFVDMFNVLPVLITAERTQNEVLVQYCMGFVKRNLDGVLNVAQRSVMDCYLREQLQTHSIASHHWLMDDFERREAKDTNWHPILKEFVLGAHTNCDLRSSNNRVAYPTDLLLFETWIESIEELMESFPAKLLMQKLRDQKKQEQTPFTNAESTTSRARGVSFGEDKVVTVAECSPRCLELTREENDKVDNGDDLFALEERKRALMKETRAVRKRLNQISKLEKDEMNAAELSYEQREKIARKSQLQLDLDKLEPVLLKVERRIKAFSSRECSTSDKCDGPSEQDLQNSKDSSAPTKFEERVSLRCQLCGITCSDEASHSLHMNGRKHRNRVLQIEQEEREQKAALLASERQKESMKKTSTAAHRQPEKVSSPWNHEPHSPAHQPNYKLPPPPHEVPSSLASSTLPKPTSLLEIMENETRKSPAKPAPKSGTMAFAPKTTTVLPKKTAGSKWASPSASKPLKSVAPAPAGWSSLKVESLPTLDSPPWAAASATPAVTQATAQPRNVNFSLNDFMAPPPSKAASPSKSKPTRVWTTSNRSPASANFASIQDEELEFKGKQDPACNEQGKWFIQQRQRAGSLKEIQKSAEQERQERLFVEEQFRIEQMILAESEKKKEEEGAGQEKKRLPNRKKKNARRKKNTLKPQMSEGP